MVKNSKGFRSRSRRAYLIKERFGITRYLQEFEVGDIVHIDPYSQSQSGLPHKKYRGKTGKIIGKRGNAYLVSIGETTLIVNPEHLRKFNPKV